MFLGGLAKQYLSDDSKHAFGAAPFKQPKKVLNLYQIYNSVLNFFYKIANEDFEEYNNPQYGENGNPECENNSDCIGNTARNNGNIKGKTKRQQ